MENCQPFRLSPLGLSSGRRTKTKSSNLPTLQGLLAISIVFTHLLISRLLSFAPVAKAEASYKVADIFSPPLGYRDGLSYGPRLMYDQSGQLIENTDYGIKNPDLQGNTCFGVEFNQLYHAGEDPYREDEGSTVGAEVTAVANGQVLFTDTDTNYPGLVVIIEHTLPSGQKVYSVYSHIDPASLEVEAGQVVSRGQRLGTVMYLHYTGRSPDQHPSGDDSHLHFEIRYFYKARNIYPAHPACNKLIPGRGYTYPAHPNDFPTPDAGYTDPLTFIQVRASREPLGQK